MAELRHRPAPFEEVADDALAVGVVPDVLRRAPAGNDERDVRGGIDVLEREVGGPGVARLLGVRVEAFHEVVDDELEPLL